jgi:hypothetical protein
VGSVDLSVSERFAISDSSKAFKIICRNEFKPSRTNSCLKTKLHERSGKNLTESDGHPKNRTNQFFNLKQQINMTKDNNHE